MIGVVVYIHVRTGANKTGRVEASVKKELLIEAQSKCPSDYYVFKITTFNGECRYVWSLESPRWRY